MAFKEEDEKGCCVEKEGN
jgi:hypothetical protein